MKKTIGIICFAGLSSLLAFTAKAQDNLSLGVKGSIGHSWMSGDGTNKLKPAYGAGLRLVYSANTNLGLGADLMFSAEGAKKEFGEGATEIRSNLNYIRLAPQAIYFFGEYGDALRPKIFAGPSLGFLVGGKTKTTIGNTTTSVSSDDLYRGFDLGALVGAGLNYRIAPGKWLNLDLGYTHGFIDQVEAGNASAYNRNIALGVGLTWGIGKVKPERVGLK